MTPPPSIALFLLGVTVFVMVAATNAAAYHQWRSTDVSLPAESQTRDGRLRSQSADSVSSISDD